MPFTAVKLSGCNIQQITFQNRTLIEQLNVTQSFPVHITAPPSCHAVIQQQIYLVICSFIPSVVWCAFGHGTTWCALSQMKKVMNTWQPAPFYYLCSWLHRTVGPYFGWPVTQPAIPKEISVRREYCIRSGYYLCYLMTLSVAKIVWRMCEMNGTSVRSTGGTILTGQTPSTLRSIRPNATSSIKPPVDCPGNQLGPPRCEAGDYLFEPPKEPGLYKQTRTLYSPVVTICTASLTFTNCVLPTQCVCVDLRTLLLLLLLLLSSSWSSPSPPSMGKQKIHWPARFQRAPARPFCIGSLQSRRQHDGKRTVGMKVSMWAEFCVWRQHHDGIWERCEGAFCND